MADRLRAGSRKRQIDALAAAMEANERLGARLLACTAHITAGRPPDLDGLRCAVGALRDAVNAIPAAFGEPAPPRRATIAGIEEGNQ